VKNSPRNNSRGLGKPIEQELHKVIVDELCELKGPIVASRCHHGFAVRFQTWFLVSVGRTLLFGVINRPRVPEQIAEIEKSDSGENETKRPQGQPDPHGRIPPDTANQ
jgi:hypothetical protein